ncbi:hypothetical protein HNE05_07995 [Aquipseudomonas campi]|uniref:Uncharacterized protein n=1 Tax=Aquipseudomonas campi TaxID=2731681 RepID=A0A6M8G265_9GAMM|nr:hypothetical protein [Pseudomonas campi]QKE63305.1 hypothetical protein HNE05_07995 [Pseudomonas campi]
MLIWKIIFWISTSLIIFAVLTLPFAYIRPDAIDIIALAIQIFGQFCLYGYAYQKAVGTKRISIAAFLLNLALGIYSLTEAAPLLLDANDTLGIAAYALAASIIAIILIPLYFYSFKSEHIWKRAA